LIEEWLELAHGPDIGYAGDGAQFGDAAGGGVDEDEVGEERGGACDYDIAAGQVALNSGLSGFDLLAEIEGFGGVEILSGGITAGDWRVREDEDVLAGDDLGEGGGGV
jgi:hypothetical protein